MNTLGSVITRESNAKVRGVDGQIPCPLVVRDAHHRQVTEPGVDAVYGILGLCDVGDDLRGLLHLALRGTVKADGHVPAGDRDDVADGEIVAGEPEGGYFRFSRYQAPSLV